jgi:hypothetical protein
MLGFAETQQEKEVKDKSTKAKKTAQAPRKQLLRPLRSEELASVRGGADDLVPPNAPAEKKEETQHNETLVRDDSRPRRRRSARR